MIELKADSWFEIKGRGMVATFEHLPDGYYEPLQFKYEQVMIDGVSYKVMGVERFAIPECKPSAPYHGAFGLLVKES